MKDRRLLRKARIGFWLLLFAAYAVGAAGVVLDVLSAEYRALSQVAVTSVQSPEETRLSGAAQVAAVYRAQSGAPFSSLPPGSTFKVVWPDGSSEYVVVVSPSSTAGVKRIPGSQQAAARSTPASPDDVGVTPARAGAR